jgi:pimeloyl-ACP methyl ester carboxylesterase
MPFADTGAGRIEYQCIGGGNHSSRTWVILHGGSVSMWQGFSTRLSHATGDDVLVYSRLGYGKAEAYNTHSVENTREEALVRLPALLECLAIERPILLGHSEAASIVLIHAGAAESTVSGVVVLAPHVFVEGLTVSNIAAARLAYQTTGLRARLNRPQDEVDGTTHGVNDIWLNPAFRNWNIEEHVSRIRCPILAIQHAQDDYGTVEQIERIARINAHVQVLRFDAGGHSPDQDQPDAVVDAVKIWAREAWPTQLRD